MADIALDRKALYYPYLQVRDVSWLKATLLCFPQVRLMIPASGFSIPTAPEFTEFTKSRGEKETLLVPEYLNADTDGSPTNLAQKRLLVKLKENKAEIKERYSMKAMDKSQSGKLFCERIYRAKLGGEFWDFLRVNGLATVSSDEDGRDMIFLHQDLGEAIMSVMAIALAHENGLDIVTDSPHVHHAISTHNEDEVFSTLLNQGGQHKFKMEEVEKVDELAMVVLHTQFDVSRLTADQIADLIADGKDLRRFKDALFPFAATLPNAFGVNARKELWDAKAGEVTEEWHKYQKSLPRYALDALINVQDYKLPEYITALTAGAAFTWHQYLAIPLAVGLVSYKGWTAFDKFKKDAANPFAYLSHVEKKVGSPAQQNACGTTLVGSAGPVANPIAAS